LAELPHEVATQLPDEEWTLLVRRHSHAVVVSLLAAGVRLQEARALVDEAWARLYEQHRAGRLAELKLPGLAIAQARFLALQDYRQLGRLASVPPGLADPSPDAEARLIGKERLTRVERALRAGSRRATEVFTMVYENPDVPHAELAQRLGMSVQRLRQTLCVVRARLRAALEDGNDV
jgi:RNA polymerase sigma-70 factor (ECF subfamily)